MNIIDVGLSFGTMNMNNHPEMIIVHHLEAEGPTWTVQQIHDMHIREHGWSGIGYHRYIRLDGRVYQGRPDNAIGAHTQGCNSNTLGVVFEGNYDSRTKMPDAQYKAWCEVKSDLNTKYGNMPVYGHRDNPRTPGSSECPGKYFPLSNVKYTTTQSKQGWNQNVTEWWYCTDIKTGSFCRSEWEEIDGEWYSFDAQGYARSNCWIQDGGKWYWLRSNCSMAKSQWLWVDGECYCFDQNGALYTNCITPDGYHVDESGAWLR